MGSQVMVVTGGASGIGRALCLQWAEAGHAVATCDMNEAGLEATGETVRRAGVPFLGAKVDVSDAEAVAAFAASVQGQLGAPDCVVNNAGVGLSAGFLDTSLEDWNRIVSINLMGVVHGCRSFAPAMIERGRGHLVNIASSAGLAPSQTLSAYSTTKFAVVGLSNAMRQEFAPRGVKVTAVCPGVIDTAIVKSTPARGWQTAPALKDMSERGFARRAYSPERAAGAIIAGIRSNPAILPIAPEAWMIHYMRRLAPGVLEWIDTRGTEMLRRRHSES